jgi:ABC-type nitrate/sulfonate/bicarbonate transport system substrate-binding protein/outer membrane protein OmpA-like peptidoglycan-associated protein
MKCHVLLAITCLIGGGLLAQKPQYQDAAPLSAVVKGPKQSVSPGKLTLPLITWGGDVATILAQRTGLFQKEGLDVELMVENNFPKQVEACLQGKTPFLRGTYGMIQAAGEVFNKQGLDLVVIYQLTWSAGGDAVVVRNARKPQDLKGKTIALQLYGPHMDYAANILASASVPLNSVQFRWLSELTLPTFDTGGAIVDPVSAFLADKNLDAALCIIPDALNLTSGGKDGTGASGSVKGASILLSTRTANRIIADVYAVRSDYLAKNRQQVQKLVHSLLKAEEALAELQSSKNNRMSEYMQLMTASADLLLGASQAVPDVEALLGDCEFAGFNGNVAFFTGQGTTRNFQTLAAEIQPRFKTMGLLSGQPKVLPAEWDYAALADGLKNATKVAPTKRFDAQKVAAKVEKQMSVESTSWAEEGTLFQIEILFDANQSEFSESQYAADYQKAVEIAETYGGSLIMIEGHSDPLGILKARQKGVASAELHQMEQQARNLSLERAHAVRQSFLSFAKRKGLRIDESQFVAVGMGVASPKFNPPRTQDEWAGNRRVVFRIKQIEAELSEFTPLD